jgi:hypothetical protein
MPHLPGWLDGITTIAAIALTQYVVGDFNKIFSICKTPPKAANKLN